MRLTCVALAIAVFAARIEGQAKFPPDSLVNLKVLPRGTPVPQVIAMMRDFTTALGVRCTHCHVGEEGKPLTTYDFASDDKGPKRTARTMMGMATAINNEHLAKIADRPPQPLRVRCETCHRGVARPVPIEQLVDEAVRVSADSAGRVYRSLMQRYRERGAYDFTELPLAALAQRLVPQGRLDDALRVTELNGEVHPASAIVPVLLGELLLQKRDTAGAVAAFRTAVQRDPASPARARLTQLEKKP